MVISAGRKIKQERETGNASWIFTILFRPGKTFKSTEHLHTEHDFIANGRGMIEKVRDFIFLGSNITVDGDCSQEIKMLLLLGRKAMTNLDSILKSKDIILPTKVLLVKAMIFPVVMYGREHWTIKKAACQRIDTFELWRTESPLDCKEIKPVNPKEKYTLNILWKD